MSKPFIYRHILVILAAIIVTSTLQATAYAQSPNRCPTTVVSQEQREDVLEMTMLGVACFERGEFGQALTYYRAAYKKSKEPLLEAAIGRSLHELGLLGLAKIYYNLYLTHETTDADGRERIKERLARLNTQLEDSSSTITINAFPGQAQVYVQTHEGHREHLGETPLTIELEPRKYTFILEQQHFTPDTFTVNMSPGETDSVNRELVPQRASFNLTTRATRRVGTTTALIGLPILLTGATLRIWDKPLTHRESNAVMLVGASTFIVGSVITAIGYRRERTLKLNHHELTLSTSIQPNYGSFSLSW